MRSLVAGCSVLYLVDGHIIMSATKISTEAKILSADVMKKVVSLEESIERAPSTDFSMSREVRAVNKSRKLFLVGL